MQTVVRKGPLWIVLWLLAACKTHGQANQKPNIFFIAVDDMGNNDIGYNNPEVETPNLNNLGNNGVILESNYVYPVCSPSRSAFMTGRYAHKTGFQHGTVEHNQPAYIDSSYKTVAEKLTQSYGYAAHMVGKWHLGYCKDSVTPTYRGFDSFYGFYGGQENYYTYNVARYNDFRDNLTAVTPKNPNYPREDVDGYSTFEYVKRAVEIVKNHDKTQPLFLYLAFQAPHTPLQAPQELIDKYPGSWTYTDTDGSQKTTDRGTFYALVTAVDMAVGTLHQELENQGLLDNAIIVFTSDNGGQPKEGGFNNPYRGAKGTFYEGGVRVPGFVYSKSLLTKTSYRHRGLLHASDWLPTFISLAGESADLTSDNDLISIDGVDQTQMLLNGGDSARSKIVLNIDDFERSSTIYGVIKQFGTEVWKYVQGNIGRRDIVYSATKTSKKRALKRSFKSERTKRAVNDKYLYLISADSSETHNLYGDTTPEIQDIQNDLEDEVEAEKLKAVPPMNPYNCGTPNNLLNGFWSAGPGDGWCNCIA
ncbi:arylsulfatase I-like [Crassostrea virginica]|uniref:Arylsulfatase I-like isoform X3 n=1 Tax=Crassostrea virginica TaxID=6565 RepID=A0A8B8DLR6_CRAVI|nr:arylsulfatase I-like isoform X3 [Crassostrea virginica]